MALRTKTIEYAFPTYETALAAATRYDFAAITLYIPETTSRTFRSVIVQITCRGTETAATSMTSWIIGIKLGAAAFSNVTVTDTITNSGEQQTFIFTRDVASYFATNFDTGTSQDCQVGVQFGALGTINITAKLIITYEYNDSATTRVKTVRIPLESNVGALTVSLASIGSNQIPLLDTFLPEASKTYRNIFFEVFGNEATNGTADFSLNLALDAESADADGLHECGMNSACFYYHIWVRNDMTTDATHDIKASVTSTTGGTFNHLCVVLVVTYEYDHANSTSIMNSVMLPYELPSPIGGTAAADCSRFQRKFFIEEPATITLVQSGVLLRFNEAAAIAGLNFRMGTQAFRAYTHAAGAMTCGQFSLVQRIDSGSAQGAGVTIARGENTINIDIYRTSTTVFGSNLSGMIYLNYTSGKHTNGDAVHNHTTVWKVGDTAADVILREFSAVAPNIPETYYWVTAIGYIIHWITSAGGVFGVVFLAENLTGEGPAEGWRDVYSDAYVSDAENGVSIVPVRARDDFQRHPNDPDNNRMAVEGSRKHRLYCQDSIWSGALMLITYHSITFAVSGTVSGYSGDGSGIKVEIHRTDTDEKVTEATTAAGGEYSATWYDNAIELYAHARQDAAHVGRSNNGLAS